MIVTWAAQLASRNAQATMLCENRCMSQRHAAATAAFINTTVCPPAVADEQHMFVTSTV